MAEILDGPPEWAGTQFESPEEDLAPEIGLTHPRWRGTPVGIRWGALYAYRKVEVAGDRHGYRYQGPWGALVVRLGPAVQRPTGHTLTRPGGRARTAGLGGAGGGGFLLPWLLHITMYELCERPCCAPFRLPKPGS
jgi:hypothetical protein